ncbi:hypothetical protein DFH29DRAFT_1002158 [Suillus ampliporus]|nr:hypothetical protein DFH29DRAFT_1002158 [Suillus ampliporus]
MLIKSEQSRPSSYLKPPLSLLSMDELICLGCGKAFNSQRRLSAHETLCETHHEFSKQISKSYRHSERNRKIKKRKINHRESFGGEEDGDAILPDLPQEMGDVDAEDWHIQACLDYDIPGPSQCSPAHSPPLPESSAAPRLSNRSGRVIRMPKRYADFVPGEDVPEVPPPEDVISEERDGNNLIPFQTEPDAMGLYRVYPTRPTLFPQTGTAPQYSMRLSNVADWRKSP